MAVEKIEFLEGTSDTYDITIEDNSNYLVVSGKTAILAHNCKHFLVEHIIGPVTSKVEPDQVKPKVYIHSSGVKPKYEYKMWVYAMQFLARDKKRMKFIADLVMKDVIAGHHVLIPVTFVKHANDLTDLLNKKLYKKYGKSNLAIAFTSKIKDRQEVLKRIRKGKIKVTVGIRSLIQAGINVPIWSSLFEIAPISNVPNFTQEVARIRTPAPELKKPQPVIHHILDENLGGMSTGCFASCFQTYKPFEWDPESYNIAINTLKKSKRGAMGIEERYDSEVAKPSRLVGFDDDDKKNKSTVRSSGFGALNTNSRK